MQELIAFLDKHLAKDDLADAFDKYRDFESYKRTRESVPEFISEFDSKYKKLVKKKIELPPEILAFKLIMASDISREKRMFIIGGSK